MSDFTVLSESETLPLYAEIERLKREIATMRAQHKLHACAGESIADTQIRLYSAACRYEIERDALADALKNLIEVTAHLKPCPATLATARKTLAQVRK